MGLDLVLAGGLLVDGSGAAPRLADVGVHDGRIQRIAPPGTLQGATVLDISHRVLAPGFIDAHTHDDRYLLTYPGVPAKTSQGVTTVVAGNCGISLAPWLGAPGQELPAPLSLLGERSDFRYRLFADYLGALERQRVAVNVVALVGHSTLRAGVMGELLDRAPRPAELAHMQSACAEALHAGAAGVSIGTFYPPARAASNDEIVAVCEPMSRLGGVLASHLRDEADGLMDALAEALEAGRRIGVPLIVSHHKAAGVCNHGRSVQSLAAVDRAAQGQPVGMDAYPYTASSTMLRLDRVQMAQRTLIAWSKPHPELAGLDFEAACERLGCDANAAVERLSPASATYFLMHEDDVARILRHPLTMIGSDGLPHDHQPHPRLWGTFARVLGPGVREQRWFDLQTAVYKMTGLPARRFGLFERGQVREGWHADLVVFDPARISDRADFTHPTAPAEGIDLVLVGGVATSRAGQATGATPGRVLRRGAGLRRPG